VAFFKFKKKTVGFNKNGKSFKQEKENNFSDRQEFFKTNAEKEAENDMEQLDKEIMEKEKAMEQEEKRYRWKWMFFQREESCKARERQSI